jgi:hypothetical protein
MGFEGFEMGGWSSLIVVEDAEICNISLCSYTLLCPTLVVRELVVREGACRAGCASAFLSRVWKIVKVRPKTGRAAGWAASEMCRGSE